jgi:MFS transporter, ACDE family, multidrug resistance protein
MVYAATSWPVGPMLGVALHAWWAAAPFILAGFWALCLLSAFWFLRLGNGKQIAMAKKPALNPLAYLMPFFQQRRLIAGWLFAVIRSCGWWVYVVYLPIFCIEAGLGDKVGGIALSTSNALLFVAPLISRAVKRHSVRRMVRMAFGVCGVLFAVATIVSPLPWLTVAAVMCASVFLVTLDVVGGLPFMMAVKPSQRTGGRLSGAVGGTLARHLRGLCGGNGGGVSDCGAVAPKAG